MKTLSCLRHQNAFRATGWIVALAAACGGTTADSSSNATTGTSSGGGSGVSGAASLSGGSTGSSTGVAGASQGQTSGTSAGMSGKGAASGGGLGASGDGTSGAGSGAGGSTGDQSGTSSGGAGQGASGDLGGSGSSAPTPDAGTDEAGATSGGGLGGTVDGGVGYKGPVTAGTVTVDRNTPKGKLLAGFAGFSFEKSHMTDGFFTGTNAPLIALFKLLGPGIVRIGANDVETNNRMWVPSAQPVAGGQVSSNIGTADVDALAAFLTASGWKAMYGVSMKTTPANSAAEAKYVQSKLGASLHSIEIGNEINFFGSWTTEKPVWESYASAILSQAPNVPLAGPAAYAAIPDFTTPFAKDEGSKLVCLTEHYYRAGAASSVATMNYLLATDSSVVSDSQLLTTAASSLHDGFRWGEMNSYSGHGKAGVSDAFGSALWGIDFMLNTAQYGSTGVNFHGGGENMDSNNCTNGPSSCTKPFRYSPIDEANAAVTGAAPLYYGMLFVSRAGTGTMYSTTVKAGSVNFTAYSVGQSDGSTNIALINKDSSNGVSASISLGGTVASATASYLLASSLTATSGVTFAGAGVTPAGSWAPTTTYALAVSGGSISVVVPPASAVLVHAQ